MDSNEDFDASRSKQKSRRASRIAIVFLFLLAFFWSVSSFFIWLFLGAAAYCLFLASFYNSRTSPGQPESASSPIMGTEVLSKRIKLILPIILGMFILAVVVKMNVSSSTNEAPEKSQSDDGSDRPDTDNDQSVDSLITLGNDSYNQGKLDPALTYYNKALSLDPSNQYALYDKALVYYDKKEFERTVPILLSCIHQYPDYGDALWLLGDVYYDRKNMDSAKVCFDRAYQTGLRNGTFLQLMAGVYETQDKSRAIELYKESIQKDSSLVDSYKKLAEADPSSAEEYLEMMNRWKKKSGK